MKIADFQSYEIHIPTSGGKAGKGCAVSGSVQVRKAEFILKSFRFTWADKESRQKALRKAKEFIVEQETKKLAA